MQMIKNKNKNKLLANKRANLTRQSVLKRGRDADDEKKTKNRVLENKRANLTRQRPFVGGGDEDET